MKLNEVIKTNMSIKSYLNSRAVSVSHIEAMIRI